MPKSLGISGAFKRLYSSLFNVTRSKTTGDSSSGISKTQVIQHSRFNRSKDDAMSEEHLTQVVGESDTEAQFPKSGTYPLDAVSMGGGWASYDSLQLPRGQTKFDTLRHNAADPESPRHLSSEF